MSGEARLWCRSASHPERNSTGVTALQLIESIAKWHNPPGTPAVSGPGKAPYLHVGYSVADIHRTFLLATLPALAIAAWTHLVNGGFAAFITAWSIMTVTVLAVSLFWHLFFARVRSRRLDSGWLMHGWLFALMVPHDLPLSLAAVGISAGAVVGSLMFGGTGRYLVSPALVGVVLVSLSYPESFAAAESVSLWSRLGAEDGPVGGNWWQAFLTQDSVATGSMSAAACLLGALILSLAGAISWRIIAGALLGTALAAALFGLAGHGNVPVHWHWIVGVFPFYLAFVATDPTVAPVIRPGRWLYGALVGALIVTIRTAAPDHPEGTIAACLVASLFAPLIDRCCLPILLRPGKKVTQP